MVTAISHNAAETFALGEAWGQSVLAGTVFGLTGSLGAGKTQLVKGLARGLGIQARVRSPTFGLVNEYREGRFPFYHLDLYRLESRQQIIAAGLDQYWTDPEAIVVIEWIERWLGSASARGNPFAGLTYRHVQIDLVTETERRIVYEDFSR